ncbi:hypothetical protein [Thorsellia anophelis]|nr:hypothetical protein [Thorsellia anophelis]
MSKFDKIGAEGDISLIGDTNTRYPSQHSQLLDELSLLHLTTA